MVNLFLILTIIWVASASKINFQPTSTNVCQGADPSVTTYFPYDGDCNKYIECTNEVPTIFQCSEGLWWHQEITDCDYPGDYCTDSTVSPGTTGTATLPPSTTPSGGGLGPDPRCVDENPAYWSHPVLCGRYIECHEGNSYEMACPPGLYFSERLQECVNAEDSECCSSKEC